MIAGLEIVRGADERSAAEVASWSRSSLDAPLEHDARLWVTAIRDHASLAGAFQRVRPEMAEALPRDGWAPDGARRGGAHESACAVFRRGSGGPTVRVGPRTIHVALALARPGALVAANEGQIVNRAVRPLLRGLSRAGHLAAFFGRDWVSVAKRPAAWVGFAHDAATRRTVFEAYVAVEYPFALAGHGGAGFRGKPPGTLEQLAERPVDERRVARAIIDAYAEGHEVHEVGLEPVPVGADPLALEPPWEAVADEAIGVVGAGRDASGTFRVGGDILVSRDALARLEAAVRESAPDESLDALGRRVVETLGAPGVALEGVRSLGTVRDVIARARRRPEP